ncbi:MAG: hypothetical protein PHY14_01300 [Candidatus Gracilibacteria bacterium]|nr:hypothetical protein [Candidatus Gracilibacteria bacterium]
MKYTEIQHNLATLQVFGISDLKMLDDKFNKSKLSDWKKSGYIKQIIRGFYLYGNTKINQNLLFKTSNTIYAPSYISLESAFSYYGFIPEQTFSITAVSTNKTAHFDTDFSHFTYKKINPTLFWGYQIITIDQTKFLIAEREKAIIDYLYLNTHIKCTEDFEGLRLNEAVLREKIDQEKLIKYANMFGKKTVIEMAHLLLKFIAG